MVVTFFLVKNIDSGGTSFLAAKSKIVSKGSVFFSCLGFRMSLLDGQLFFGTLLKLISSWELLVLPYFHWFLIIFIVDVSMLRLNIGFGTDKSL